MAAIRFLPRTITSTILRRCRLHGGFWSIHRRKAAGSNAPLPFLSSRYFEATVYSKPLTKRAAKVRSEPPPSDSPKASQS
jgi:hypothetical protein